MESKKKRTIRDARSFGLGIAWGLPMIRMAREFIESEYQIIRYDYLGIACLVGILFILSGRDNWNDKSTRDY